MSKAIELSEELARQLALLPDAPGVYIFKNSLEETIYIGKALSLKARVRSYWSQTSWLGRPKLAVLVPRIAKVDVIQTNSEKEALLLEATLVRRHMPRYNVSLKDDKRYPWLCITYEESFPRLIMIRDPVKHKQQHPKDKVFGPYVEAGWMWQTVRILRKVFPLRQRRKPLFKDRPCMNYHIGLCLGPCQKLVEEGFYNHMVAQVELFLSGRQAEAVRAMEKEMAGAAENLRFEEAAALRDRVYALKLMMEKQQVLFQDQKVSLDVVAEAHTEKLLVVCLMRVREGKLIGSESFDLPLVDKTSFEEGYQSFIEQYYAECEDISIPREVLLQHNIEDGALLASILSQRAMRVVKLAVPLRGDKQKLLEMAKKNASTHLDKAVFVDAGPDGRTLELLTKLQEELSLTCLPRRMECFDISNIQGTNNVASMVVFEDGQAKKSDYRTFKIRSVEGEPNDFASMKEVIGRRFARLRQENKPLPDLVIIDGGKGQLNAALEALAELEIRDLNIMGLAKKQEELYFPGRSEPVWLPRRSETLFLLQRIRDEAHRFAIAFHRKQRAKRVLSSGFDELPGVGAVRKRNLMLHFGSFANLQNASLDDLRSVPQITEKIAARVYDHLHPSSDLSQ